MKFGFVRGFPASLSANRFPCKKRYTLPPPPPSQPPPPPPCATLCIHLSIVCACHCFSLSVLFSIIAISFFFCVLSRTLRIRWSPRMLHPTFGVTRPYTPRTNSGAKGCTMEGPLPLRNLISVNATHHQQAVPSSSSATRYCAKLSSACLALAPPEVSK